MIKTIYRNKDLTAKEKKLLGDWEELEHKFSDLLKECISEDSSFWKDLYDEPPKPDYNKLLKEYKHKRHERRMKYAKTVATITTFAIASGITCTYIIKDPAIADKIKRIITLELQEPVKREKTIPGNGDSDFKSTQRKFKNLESVNRFKQSYPELYVPNYIPPGYNFVNLTTIDDSYNFYAVWEFVNNKNDLLVITQYGINTPFAVSAVLSDEELNKIVAGFDI